MIPDSIDATVAWLERAGYVPERGLAATVYFALQLQRPLFLEGQAGVGKTEIAKVLATALGRELIRLQCFDGMDQSAAVYEWNYQKQMIAIRLAEASGRGADEAALGRELFGPDFLQERPLLRALAPGPGGMPVLLIDELDRADEPFEAYLMEILSDFQVSIPELGTVRAQQPPIVVVTSNRTREIHDAIKRRCFYYWVDYPDARRELEILRRKVPGVAPRLAHDVVAFAQQLRGLDLFKAPGVSETLDWAQALMRLDLIVLDADAIAVSLGLLLKYQDDLARVRALDPARLLESARAALPDPAVVS